MEYLEFQALYTQVEDGAHEAEPVVDLLLQADLARLEQQLCEYVGARHCVGVSNATTGLIMALRAAGVREGDAVLCTPFGFFATREVLLMLGAAPLPVDVNPGTWTIDPYCLEYVIGRRVREKKSMPKALIAVDLFGLPCDYAALQAICDQHGIALIEDLSQALGAGQNGVKAGNFGRFAVTSFFPARALGDLHGGAVFCRTQEDARLLRTMRGEARSHGALCRESIHATLVAESLLHLDEECARRQEVAARYRKNLDGVVKLRQIPETYTSAHNQYGVLLRDKPTRDSILQAMQERDIPCRRYATAPLYRTADAMERVMLHGAQSVAERLLLLPMHPYLSTHVVEYVSTNLAELVWSCEEPHAT